jgi:hypothetical protein
MRFYAFNLLAGGLLTDKRAETAAAMPTSGIHSAQGLVVWPLSLSLSLSLSLPLHSYCWPKQVVAL